MSHNKITPANAGIALSFHVGHTWPGIAEMAAPYAMRFLTIILATLVITGCGPAPQKPNQRTPSSSPSGKFVLTVPIERDPTDRNLPFWRMTISDTAGKQLYKDDSKFIGTLNVYWCWDSADRVWLYNSDDDAVYVWQIIDGQWQRSPFTVAGPLKPPDELLPDYERNRKK